MTEIRSPGGIIIPEPYDPNKSLKRLNCSDCELRNTGLRSSCALMMGDDACGGVLPMSDRSNPKVTIIGDTVTVGDLYLELGTGDDMGETMANFLQRKQIRKTVGTYLRDKLAWFWLPRTEKSFWVPPDWYQPETDVEYRERMKEFISGPG